MQDDVPDDDLLYRSVRIQPDELEIENGIACRIHAQAFSDRRRRISVDRASRVNFEPNRSRKSPNQAIVFLVAKETRKQAPIEHNVPRPDKHFGEWPPRRYEVGVTSNPLLDNLAHAEIHLVPYEQDSTTPFNKLKEKLKKLINNKLANGESVVSLPKILE